jgi:hypothetical protein
MAAYVNAKDLPIGMRVPLYAIGMEQLALGYTMHLPRSLILLILLLLILPLEIDLPLILIDLLLLTIRFVSSNLLNFGEFG